MSQIEAGATPSAVFIEQLNARLLEHPFRQQVVVVETGFEPRQYFQPLAPQDAFAPLASDVAALLTISDLSRLRKCQSCELHFFDTSKKGTRVWCSMDLCGNRAKVAAYAKRKRSAQAKVPR